MATAVRVKAASVSFASQHTTRINPANQPQVIAAKLTGADTPLTVAVRGSEVATLPAAAIVSALARISPPSARAATRAATWTPFPL